MAKCDNIDLKSGIFATLPQAWPVRIVRHLSEMTLATIVAAYAVIICAQVFFRFVLNDSLVWSEEVVRYGLLWGVMIGAGVASDRLAHVALDPLRSVVEGHAALALRCIVGLLILTFSAIVIWASIQYVGRLWMTTSPAASIPMRYVFSAIPVGFGLMSFFTLVHLLADSGNPQRDQIL